MPKDTNSTLILIDLPVHSVHMGLLQREGVQRIRVSAIFFNYFAQEVCVGFNVSFLLIARMPT